MRGDEWSRLVINDLNLQGQLNPDSLVRSWEENLNVLCDKMELMPGVTELINHLHSKDIKMAVATSSNKLSFDKKISRHDIFNKIAVHVCGDDPEVLRGKPEPDIYIIAAQRLGVAPNQCLTFEDAYSGVLSATAAGIHCIACPDPRLDRSQFLELTPYVVQSLLDIDLTQWRFVNQPCI